MPWRKIFTSGPVWAIIVANFCVDWGAHTYTTNIPTFFFEVFFFDITSVIYAKCFYTVTVPLFKSKHAECNNDQRQSLFLDWLQKQRSFNVSIQMGIYGLVVS